MKSEPLQIHWDKTWQAWDDEQFKREFARLFKDEVASLVIQHVPVGSTILEAGCGTGRWVAFLQTLGYKVVGIDYSWVGLKKAKKFFPGIFVLGDVAALPMASGIFDAYLSLGVLEHFVNGPEMALREAFRVLKTGGMVIATLPADNLLRKMPWYRLKKWLKRTVKATKFYEYHFQPNDIGEMLCSVGFDVLEIRPVYHAAGLAYDCSLFSKREMGITVPTRLCQLLANYLCKISPWITNHMVAVVARKSQEFVSSKGFHFRPSHAIWE